MTVTIRKEQSCTLVIGDQTICIKDILRIEGEGNYSKFHMQDGSKIISCRTLKYFEPYLLERGFIRPSKSAIVNMNAIQAIDFNIHKSIRLVNQHQVTISRRQIKPLKDLFKAAAQQS
ncbi:LytR/AlgR family response regulator transcription factor [Aquirufa lenticrescens]|uniref:LytR/AlgR family response regulator transcription factor n=1 Tax=Aquirufa lenticrescens TaxID=2696560 RepID=UPI001CAA4ECF|nr:LytTR family DNA-binding domain-containing protein [Aquirufa lenticrescens]UAJ14186.1 LytTR family transcriptional regulator [Aquirufa lenticrescens]